MGPTGTMGTTVTMGTGGSAATRGTVAPTIEIPMFVREIVEEIAFQARADQKVDRRSGVSQRLPISTLENVVSNAERRALMHGELTAVPRVADVYAALPSVTGKIELEYEGELKGAEPVAREIVRAAVATVFDGHAAHAQVRPVIDWFERGGTLDLSDTSSADDLLGAVDAIDGFEDVARALGTAARSSPPARAAVADFILEGLCALKKISRTEHGQLFASPSPARPRDRGEQRTIDQLMEDDEPTGKAKKKYYN
jgi:magnesium chelatase subunit I